MDGLVLLFKKNKRIRSEVKVGKKEGGIPFLRL